MLDLNLFSNTIQEIRAMKGAKSEIIRTLAQLHNVDLKGAKNQTQMLNRIEAVVLLRHGLQQPLTEGVEQVQVVETEETEEDRKEVEANRAWVARQRARYNRKR